MLTDRPVSAILWHSHGTCMGGGNTGRPDSLLLTGCRVEIPLQRLFSDEQFQG
jgi:hypothetical protein